MKWDLKGVECEVFVDGISFGSYADGEVSLTLSGGRHEITVETTDEFGGVLSYSITVDVRESNTPLIINIIAGAILIIVIVVIQVMRRSKLKKSAEIWREKRREIEAAKSDPGKRGKTGSSKRKKDRSPDKSGKPNKGAGEKMEVKE